MTEVGSQMWLLEKVFPTAEKQEKTSCNTSTENKCWNQHRQVHACGDLP